MDDPQKFYLTIIKAINEGMKIEFEADGEGGMNIIASKASENEGEKIAAHSQLSGEVLSGILKEGGEMGDDTKEKAIEYGAEKAFEELKKHDDKGLSDYERADIEDQTSKNDQENDE